MSLNLGNFVDVIVACGQLLGGREVRPRELHGQLAI